MDIDRSASHEDIEKARIEKIALYSEDRWRTAPDYIRKEAKKMQEKVLQAANEAHKLLDRRSDN